jgi:PAS domain S-box-containing protein
MARSRFSTVRARLMVLVLLAVLPALALLFVNAARQRRAAVDQVLARSQRLIGRITTEQQLRIEEARFALLLMAHFPEVRARNWPACSRLFAEHLQTSPAFANIGVVDSSGIVVASGLSAGPVAAGHREWFRRARARRDFAVDNLQIGAITHRPTLNAALPLIRSDSTLDAVLFVAIDLAWAERAMLESELPPHSALLLVDPDGMVIARHPDPGRWAGRSMPDLPLVRAMLTQRRGITEVRGVDGVLRLYQFAPLGEASAPSGFASVGITRASAYAEANRVLAGSLMWLLAVATLALLAAWYGSEAFLARRFRGLVEAADRVRAGDYAARAGLPQEGGEVGRLAAAFDAMAETLQQRQAETEDARRDLAESEAGFRALVEHGADAVSLIDPQGTILYAGPSTERILGYANEEFVGHNAFEFVHPDDVEQTSAKLAGLVERPEATVSAEFRMRHKDGSWRWMEGTGRNLLHDPRVRAIVSNYREITERKRAEDEILRLNRDLERGVAERTRQLEVVNRELQFEIQERRRAEEAIHQSRRELRHFVDHMSTLNAKVAPDGRLLLVNRTAELASGMEREQLMRTNFIEGPWWSFDPAVQERVRAAFARAVNGEALSYDEEILVFGRVMTINFGLAPVLDERGQVSYIVAEGRDVTAQKLAEKALRQGTTELEAANKELEAFSYSVSHDLRAPLRALNGFARILIDEYGAGLPTEAQRYLTRIRDNAQRMGTLIDDLLAFSRTSRQPLARQPVEPAQLVQEVLQELGDQQQGRRVEVTIGPMPRIQADPALLKQVYGNLIGNALKYTRGREVAEIEIGVRDGATGDEPVYYVRDNGVGFDMSHAERLFGVFQRLHRADEYEGTGLGLAIAQRIVYRHGGRIWAEAEPDKGATFYFTLGERRST